MIAPALRSRPTSTASAAAGARLPGSLQVVGKPSTSKASFTVKGSPTSGRSAPAFRSSLAARAASRARSKSLTTTALIFPSTFWIRSIAASTSSAELIFLDLRAASCSIAELCGIE
jgi:hypothetical protein